MGCDIHLYVEKKDGDDWISAEEWEIDEDGRLNVKDWHRFDVGRNYRLFAMLADVRNGRGFAGIDTGDRVNPIDEPRGIPDDVSPQVYQKYQSWSDDGHSHSYFTVQELLEYDWTQSVKNRGVISAGGYAAWWGYGSSFSDKTKGEGPESYASDVSGPNIVIMTEEELQAKLKEVGESLNYWQRIEKVPQQLPNVYCRIEWEEKYYQMARYFWANLMPQLLALGKPDEVRIVFWFDN